MEYLSAWRNSHRLEITNHHRLREQDLDVSFSSAVTEHESSDAAGSLLGEESNSFWREHKSAKSKCDKNRKGKRNAVIFTVMQRVKIYKLTTAVCIEPL